ncbi:hypothetical protein QRB38_13215 [Mycobacterium avium subsp. hominissuis]|uniref:hypothetical protein n=1 Tax=Mycobacterium TaxID=1763 RepID=UPI0006854890|nr:MULTISPECIES: hypothetical protein [Mycobacterium]MDO2394770.1 hypothetical protein [Mycobacterium avium subsp. hominissuis]
MSTPREIVRLHFPWDVPADLQDHPVYVLMRLHGDYVATGGRGMPPADVAAVHAFHAQLREHDWVVEYDPNITAAEGIDDRPGFAYRARTIDDDDLIIRNNGHTVITDEGELIWRYPPDLDH